MDKSKKVSLVPPYAGNKLKKASATDRFHFWSSMMQLNPQGFRSAPTSKKGAKSRVRQKSAAPVTMMERLAMAAFG